MLFIAHSDRSRKALYRFEANGRRPNVHERVKLERDLAELEAAAERIRYAIKTEKPRRPK
jgi:arsenate reductase-like glutaredoxin family protein